MIRKAYKFKLQTSTVQAKQLRWYAGSCRFIWNKALAINLFRLHNGKNIMYYQELDFFSKLWKKSNEYGFLQDCPSQAIQQKLKDLEKAFRDCFDKTQPNKKLPKFKKKNVGDSIRYPQGFKISKNRVFLPKMGWLKFRKSQDIVGIAKNITVSLYAGSWYVSIQVEQEVVQPLHPSTSIVGVDMGIARFATLSTEEYFSPINSFKNLATQLAKEQRSLARKKKFSSNWLKAKLQIQKIHTKIADIRRDFLHKTSTYISKNHAMIVMEDLKVANMSKSAKGSLENPGKNVRAKSGLNRSILDQGWSEFRRQIIYKQQWRGGEVVFVNPKNTSITCPNPSCNHQSKVNRLSQSAFVCEQCGYKNNADLVGAINVLRAGHARIACGDIGSVSHQAQESPKVAA